MYFEEWNEPLISGIGWVSELIELAGGEDCFAELAPFKRAKQRIIEDPQDVVRRAPELIVGSGAAAVSARNRWRPDRAGRRSRRYAMASCTRSSRRTSSTPARRC